MSNINTTDIDESFPVQGKDNNSQGFRSNFSVIKNALNVAKTEITVLENDTVKNNTDNNINGKIIENLILNNTSYLYKDRGIPTDQLILLNVTEAAVYKVRCIGNTTIRFTNWPQTVSNINKFHHLKLIIQFKLSPTDAETLNYKINFATDLGGLIKSYTQGSPWVYDATFGGWYLKPYVNLDISNVYSDYEHLFDVSSYRGGQEVFIKYLGSYI
ncbi:MAG: hypothetical protein EBT86_05120 [Actinobacteria bacterium]|nr:hypothetical protein [Actinomycetota bacterium]